MNTSQPNAVQDALNVRLLNLDSADLVCERLRPKELRRLHEWFVSPQGLDNGRAMLLKAPLLDGALHRLVAFGEDGEPDLHKSYRALFGAGLLLCVLLSHGSAAKETVSSPSLTHLLEALAEVDALELVDPKTGALSLGADAAAVTERLVELCPAVQLCIDVGARLVHFGGQGQGACALFAPPTRLMFLLGLMGAGATLQTSPPRKSVRGVGSPRSGRSHRSHLAPPSIDAASANGGNS